MEKLAAPQKEVSSNTVSCAWRLEPPDLKSEATEALNYGVLQKVVNSNAVSCTWKLKPPDLKSEATEALQVVSSNTVSCAWKLEPPVPKSEAGPTELRCPSEGGQQ